MIPKTQRLLAILRRGAIPRADSHGEFGHHEVSEKELLIHYLRLYEEAMMALDEIAHGCYLAGNSGKRVPLNREEMRARAQRAFRENERTRDHIIDTIKRVSREEVFAGGQSRP